MAIAKLASIDFEYCQSSEPLLNLVCMSIITNDERSFDIWLYKDKQSKAKAAKIIDELHEEGFTFIAYAVTAEAGSFISLGLDPLKYRWIDLYIYYRLLTNHNSNLMYGKQLIKGREVTTYRPTRGTSKELNGSKPEHNLAAACYKLLGVKLDTKHKDIMRDLIISNPVSFSDADKKNILEYCRSDVVYLKPLYEAMLREHNRLLVSSGSEWDRETQRSYRSAFSEYAVRTAKMERLGYPIDYEATKNFSKNVPKITRACVEDILSQDLPIKPFIWDKSYGRYKEQQKVIKTYLASKYKPSEWALTDKGAYSLSLDAFAKHSSARHDFKRDDLIDQMLRYKKLQQHLNGFKPVAKNAVKKTFWDSVGSDKRVRPYFGIYGAQSGRSQPAATGFIPLKAAWMRSLILPKKGRLCCGIDYGSQEFLLSAIVSGDKNMYEAYVSGDPYLYFAKQAGAVPPEGTKKTHAKERNLFKSTTLGISYNMGAAGLAKKLTADTGEEKTKEDAEKLIALFFDVSSDFAKWDEWHKHSYEFETHKVVMPCGWSMWGDNDNWRSVNNVPIQGLGATIMRKAVAFAQDAGLEVIYTLHDAVYIEFDIGDFKAVDTLAECMVKACTFYFEGDKKEWASKIRLDADVWGAGATKYDNHTDKGMYMKLQEIYVDERSVEEFEFFKEYFK